MELKYYTNKALIRFEPFEEEQGWKINCEISDLGFNTVGYEFDDNSTEYEVDIENYEDFKKIKKAMEEFKNGKTSND